MNAPITMPIHALNATLSKQRSAFAQDGAPAYDTRMADLAKLKKAVLARRHDFERSISADFGTRAAYETALMEIVPLIHGIDYLRRHLKKWMRPKRRHVALHMQPSRAAIVYQPLGVIGIVAPWNFPLSLALTPLATALAAGNRAMIKPSEITSATSALMAEMLGEIFPEEQVAIVLGGPEVGAAFSALAFDHLFFTGSTAVGRAVMRAASDNLVPVTLELGGKSPAIVDEAYSLDRAAASIAYGKLANAGQICIAPDYALVEEKTVEAFAAAFQQAVKKLYPGGSADPAYSAIVNARHFARLERLIDDARTKGATVIKLDHAAEPNRERVLPPTLVLGATRNMAIMQEEIFGPVLPVVAYKTMAEAIAFVNAEARPLALYLFSDRRNVVDQILQRTTSGNVTVNDTLLHYVIDDLPFGGVGPSGMGAYHGEEGFKTFSHAKGVFEQSKTNFIGLVRPPFGVMTDLVLRYLLR